MTQNQLTSDLINVNEYKTDLAKDYSVFLSKYPEIFSDLNEGSVFDFAIYDSIKSYQNKTPVEIFNIHRNSNSIEIRPGKAVEADIELSLSVQAIMNLIRTRNKIEYAQLLGSFYNEPDEEKGWIDFTLFKRTKTIIEMGYGKFAQTAGIFNDDGSIKK
jgi:hypothetical protein